MPRHAALISLGCSKNLADSEDLITALRCLDFQLSDELAVADLILINTCGFIEDAKRESIDHILDAATGRKPGAKLFVSGCLTERYRDELAAGLPEVDQWVGLGDYDQFTALVRAHFPDCPDHLLSHDQRSQLTPPHYAFLKIAEGCDNACNFCAIPLIRGPHVSRPEEELVAQAQVLAARGVREINLISQHLDYYGRDRYGEARLPSLLRQLSAAAPEAWIRLHYCYPNDFDDALIAAMSACPNVLPYVDMPIQHAADRSLALMGRRTKRAHIEERLQAIRAALPEVVIRSTFIVGFPGERAQDFDELLDFIQTQRFDQVGCFAYSDEEGTTAAQMPDKVPAALIAERHERFMTCQQAIHEELLRERWLGRTIEVLVDEQRDFDRWHCRHYGQAAEVDSCTIVEAEHLPLGERCQVTITGHSAYDLIATAS